MALGLDSRFLFTASHGNNYPWWPARFEATGGPLAGASARRPPAPRALCGHGAERRSARRRAVLAPPLAGRLSALVDMFDAYKIDFTNKFASINALNAADGVLWINQGAVQYKGLEGQVTYAPAARRRRVRERIAQLREDRQSGTAPSLQVANAPEWTAAAGILYKSGPIRFSLIDKYTGRQWFTDPTSVTNSNATTALPVYNSYRSNGYNSAILSARYDIGPVRVGIEVNNLFDSAR